MIDIVDKKTRSRMMAGIRGKDTKPEVLLRSEFHRRGFRFRKHVKTLAGKPDVVFTRYRSIINVHGCFWHRHSGCRFATTPATRADFWSKKFRGNVERDERNERSLRELGFRVLTVWECELHPDNANATIERAVAWLLNL